MNIKSYLRSVLSDPAIINLTGNKKVFFLHATAPTGDYVEYEIFDEDGALYAEGEEIATNFYVQVDIFSKGDYTALKNAIMAKMTSAGFVRDSGADQYEGDTQLYHKAMRFVYTSDTN